MDKKNKLFTAAENGDLDTLENLIEENSSLLKEVNSENLTPLGAALYSGQADALQLIINNGAELNVQGKDGKSTFEWAREQDENCETAALLLLTDYMDRLYNTTVWWEKQKTGENKKSDKIIEANCDSCGCIIRDGEGILLTLDEALSTKRYTDRLTDQAVKILPPEQKIGSREEITELITSQIREKNMSSTYTVCDSCRDKLFSDTVFGKNRKFILESIDKLFKEQL